MKLIENLEKFGAHNSCHKALRWIGDRTPAQAWLECERADWLLWWSAQNIWKPGWPTHQELVRVTVDCVRPVVDSKFPDKYHPAQIALETAMRWTRGEASVEECVVAARNAIQAVAAAAAAAAASAAYAPHASDAAAYSAFCTTPSYSAEHKRMCDIIRTAWPMPDALKEEK